MSHWWHCCDDDCPYGGPPDCQAKPDGIVWWFTHTVNDDNTITRVDHSGRCYTVYVNSTSGDVAETGNGTESRPFVNLNSIFTGNITKSGASGTLSGGVFTPGAAPVEWAVGRLIGAKLTLDGTDYEVTANTTTTATITDPPADDTYSWTLKIFDDDCIYNICTHADPPDNCPKVKVLVKGTIDYAVTGNSGRNYLRNLVIEPWGSGRITVDVIEEGEAYAVATCAGCIWKNTDATCVNISKDNSHGFGFSGCSSSTFDTCTGTGDGIGGANTQAIGYGYGFSGCSSSTFDTCTGTGNGAGGTGTGDPYGGAYNVHGHGFGFSNCSSSTFDTCTGTGDGIGGLLAGETIGYAYGYGYGFSGCSSSTFDTCIGTGDGIGGTESTPWWAHFNYSFGYGFSNCSSSTFDTCTGTGNSTGLNFGSNNSAWVHGQGFANCEFSAFNACDGAGDATEGGCKRACGFRQNTCSFFNNCSTSDRICDCPGTHETVCGNWICDDLDNDVEWTEHEIEGVLKLEADHTLVERETLEGVLKLEAEHALVSRETLEGVLKLEITHTLV